MMEEVQRSLNFVDPFLSKTYMMVSDPSTDAIVSWSSTNRSFIVWSQPDFSKDLLSKFFEHSNFSSFIRQLNIYGFRKIGQDQWKFANDDFVKDQPQLMRNIHRRKAIFSHSMRNINGQGEGDVGNGADAGPLTKSQRQNYRAQIEKLRQEKEQLLLERQRQKDDWKMNEMQLHYSNDHLKKLEVNQRILFAFVGQVLQRSAEVTTLMSESVDACRKRRYLPNAQFNDLSNIETWKETSQELARENAESMFVLSIDMKRLDLLESSLIFWENFLKEVNETSNETPPNLDFDDFVNHALSYVMSGGQIDFEVHPESSRNEMNSLSDMFVFPDANVVEFESNDIFVDDPVAHDEAVIQLPDPIAPELPVIVVPDPVAPESVVSVVPESIAPELVVIVPNFVPPKEQLVTTMSGNNGFYTPLWKKYLVETPIDDESEIRSELSKYCWTRRHLKPPQIDKAGKA